MSYRLLALDLDGTSLLDGHAFTPRVREAVDAARAKGVHVVVATGRSFVGAVKFAAALALDTPMICFQGALVRETSNDRATLLIEPLPADGLDDIIALAEERRLELTLYSQEHLYVSQMLHSTAFYDRWFGLPIRHVPNLFVARRQLEAEEGPVLKCLFAGEPDDQDRLGPELEARLAGRLSVVRSHPLFVEVMSPKASKGAALAFLAQRYGIPQAQTIAVGDSGNDVSMVQWAGLGVAMSNATPDVLAVADWVAPPVHEDGVVAVIERFILGNGRI